MFKKVLLIVSPVTRPSWVKRYIPSVKQAFRDAGMEVEEVVTQAAGDPERLAEQARGAFDAVLMAGGDGSINEVMNALQGTEVPVGIIPFGTVNIFAREMRIPLNPLGAADAFLKGRVEAFDMGRFGDRHFLLMASYGFDALALRKNPGYLKRILGKYSFVVTGLMHLPFFQPAPVEVSLDNDPEVHTVDFAIFSNSRYYAGEYVVAPEADMHDGLLDVTLFTAPGRLGVLKVFWSLVRGNQQQKPWVKTIKAAKVLLRTPRPELFQVDGDYFDPSAMEIEVARDAIRVVVPKV